MEQCETSPLHFLKAAHVYRSVGGIDFLRRAGFLSVPESWPFLQRYVVFLAGRQFDVYHPFVREFRGDLLFCRVWGGGRGGGRGVPEGGSGGHH